MKKNIFVVVVIFIMVSTDNTAYAMRGLTRPDSHMRYLSRALPKQQVRLFNGFNGFAPPSEVKPDHTDSKNQEKYDKTLQEYNEELSARKDRFARVREWNKEWERTEPREALKRVEKWLKEDLKRQEEHRRLLQEHSATLKEILALVRAND